MRQKGRTTRSLPQDRSRTPRIDRCARIAYPAAARTDHPQKLCSVRDIAPHSLNHTSPRMKTPQKPIMRTALPGRDAARCVLGGRAAGPSPRTRRPRRHRPNRVPGPAQWHAAAGWRRVLRRGGATVPRPWPGLGRPPAGVPGRRVMAGTASMWPRGRGPSMAKAFPGPTARRLGARGAGPRPSPGPAGGIGEGAPADPAAFARTPPHGKAEGERRRHTRERPYSEFPLNSNQTSSFAEASRCRSDDRADYCSCPASSTTRWVATDPRRGPM